MAASGGPNAVHDGLVLALDAADENSFTSGSTTWTDLTSNSNNGTLSAGTMGTVSGSNTIAFDGSSDEVSIANNSTLSFGASGDFTLECVVKLNTADDNLMILGKENGHFGQGYSIRIEESSSDNWGVQLHVEQSDGTQYRFISSTTLGQTFTHVIASFDRSNTLPTLHINGEAVTATSINSNLNAIGDLDVSQDFTIGADSGGARNINGQVPLVRVYNKALDNKQVINNFNILKSRFGV